MDNLSTTAFARDYHMTGEIAADSDGRIKALRVNVLADHGAFDACADPSKWPAGFFNIVTGSYDIPVGHVKVDGVYTAAPRIIEDALRLDRSFITTIHGFGNRLLVEYAFEACHSPAPRLLTENEELDAATTDVDHQDLLGEHGERLEDAELDQPRLLDA